MAQVFAINLRHWQTMATEMPGEFEESSVLFTNAVQDADGGGFAAGQPDDLSTGTAKLALQWLDLLDRRVKMSFKKLLQNVHERDTQRPAVTKITGDRLHVTVPKASHWPSALSFWPKSNPPTATIPCEKC